MYSDVCRWKLITNGLLLAALVVVSMVITPASAQQTMRKGAVTQRENLGAMINSEHDEVFPVIAPDGKTLFFVRKNHPQNTGEYKEDDIWYSELQPDGGWGKAKNIGPPLNTDGYNFVCSVLSGNNTLLLGNQYMPDGTQRQGVSLSRRTGEQWSFPVNLTIDRLGNLSRLSEYTMSPDGRVIVMSLLRKDSIGGRDLFVSFRESDSTWSEPENMGIEINSKHQDITPFIAADGVTIYFSSNRPGGYGSSDVYMARRRDSSWKEWTPPQLLDSPVNSAGWDAYFSVPGSGEYAYFVSTEEGFGKSDIFRIQLPEAFRPIPVPIWPTPSSLE